MTASPLGIDPDPRAEKASAVRLVVVSACVLCGGLLLVLFLQQRIAPSVLQLPPFPFFDKLVMFSRPLVGPMGWTVNSTFIVLHLVAAVLLLVNAWAILSRRRFAFPLFALTGWGGFIVTLASLYPGDDTRFKLRTLMNVAQKQGVATADTRIWELIPTRYYVYAGLFLAAWTALLVIGTVHLARSRDRGPH